MYAVYVVKCIQTIRTGFILTSPWLCTCERLPRLIISLHIASTDILMFIIYAVLRINPRKRKKVVEHEKKKQQMGRILARSEKIVVEKKEGCASRRVGQRVCVRGWCAVRVVAVTEWPTGIMECRVAGFFLTATLWGQNMTMFRHKVLFSHSEIST